VEAPFERHARAAGLRLLAAAPGERILEIGPGTGHTLVTLASQVGPAGTVVGVDLSARMPARTRRRLARAGYTSSIAVVQGDARQLPIGHATVDAVMMSFVLDLIDTDQIPPVLAECRRVLRPAGRLGIVALDLAEPPPAMTRLYLWGRRHLPRLLDCRPIPVADLLTAAGWQVCAVRRLPTMALPMVGTLAMVNAGSTTSGTERPAHRQASRRTGRPAASSAAARGYHTANPAPRATVSRPLTRTNVSDQIDRRINDVLRMMVREKAGRAADPSLLVLDSQSVRAAARVPKNTTGLDAAKRPPGRRRGLAVDVIGLITAVVVTAASMHDNAIGARLLDQVIG
jgi:SAM-dependent methyltransferase